MNVVELKIIFLLSIFFLWLMESIFYILRDCNVELFGEVICCWELDKNKLGSVECFLVELFCDVSSYFCYVCV